VSFTRRRKESLPRFVEIMGDSVIEYGLLPGVSEQPAWTAEAFLRAMNVAFQQGLTNQSPMVDQPAAINLPLRNHQRAIIYAMAERERASMHGIPFHQTNTYANYGVLGDEVGSGKSLAVLGYLAWLKEQGGFSQSRTILYPRSSKHFFTVMKTPITNTKAPSLIVVPHTIYKQWEDYCKKQTKLSVFFVKSTKSIQAAYNLHDASGNLLLQQSFQESDAVLVSNTLYSEVSHFAKLHGIRWSRMFIDEVDTVYIPGTNPEPEATFTWFISATWQNLIFNGGNVRPAMLEYYEQHSAQFSPELGDWIRSELGANTYSELVSRSYSPYARWQTNWFRVKSTNWLKSYHSEHGLRAIVLLHCSKAFLNESRQMPLIHHQTLVCLQPASHRVLKGLVSQDIQNMLHGGNIDGALQALGVSSDTTLNLVEAVGADREKELERLKKTLVFKSSMDYASPQAKEQALQNLQGKILSVESQLKTFRDRLSVIQSEECPICYEDPNLQAAVLTPCCHRIFCANCMLSSLKRVMTCPLCRAAVEMKNLTQIVKEKKKETKKQKEEKLLSKHKQLLQFLVDNPKAKVLVFSRYENPFKLLEQECEEVGVAYHTLRGNKDVIAATIRSFEQGEKRVLFLSTECAGAGINLVSATHVVLYHAMTPEEEKQAVGRAYRLGRTDDLHVVRLLHEGEQPGQ
jgi:hypothetical protein